MAIIPSAEYPGQIDLDPTDYPQGKARNAGSYQDGTGTPLEETWLNDLWGFLQALLAAAEITPTGDPDTATASQYLDAVRSVATVATGARHLRALMQMRELSLNGIAPQPENFMAVASVPGSAGLSLLVKAGPDGAFRIGDDSRVANTSGIDVNATPGGDVRSIASNGSNRFIVVGNNGASENYFSTTGTSWTAGGALPGIGTPDEIVWDGTEFIVMSGDDTCHSTDGVTWTAAATPVTGGVGNGLAVLVPGTVFLLAVGIFITTDHGVTWTALAGIPTTIVGGTIRHCAGDGSGDVVVVIKSTFDDVPTEIWASSDGVTWTKRSEILSLPTGTTELRVLFCQDTGLLVLACSSQPVHLHVSTDRGRTWSPRAFYHQLSCATIGVALGRVFGASAIGGVARIYGTDPLAV